MKKALSFLLALALVLSLGGFALAADNPDFKDLVGETWEVTEPVSLHRLTIDETSSITAPAGCVPIVTKDGYVQTIEPGESYAFYGSIEVYPLAGAIVGEPIRGASAAYAEQGAKVAFADQTFVSYGFISGEYYDQNGDGVLTDDEFASDARNEYGSKFGMAAGVLAVDPSTEMDLDGVTILCGSGSDSNGAFAANGSTINIKNSTVITNNSSGHGLDATFGGTFIVDNCVIRTNGGASSALSTDFGGGNFLVTNTYAESNTTGSGGIYAAGSSIYVVKNSTLHANKSEAVMNAHNNSVVVCKDSLLHGPEIFDGHQAMPSPAMASGDTTFSFDCAFEAVDNAVIHQQGGVTTHYIVNCDTSACTADYAVQQEYENGMGSGKLFIHLWDTELTGDVYCFEGGVIEINLYDGAKLTGEVIKDGECEVTINVYEGGEYVGEYKANEIKESVPAPVYSDDTFGSIDWIQNESGYWMAGNAFTSYQNTWDEYVRPVITAASTNVNGENTVPEVILVSGEMQTGVDLFDLFIEYIRAQLQQDEFYDEFSSALDTVFEAGYDETQMPFAMFIENGAMGYEDFCAYYEANGEFPPPASF